MVRASIRYCSWKDRKKITAALRTERWAEVTLPVTP